MNGDLAVLRRHLGALSRRLRALEAGERETLHFPLPPTQRRYLGATRHRARGIPAGARTFAVGGDFT